ncbi:hypothetical protein BDV40DRAFT_271806 [Aspergillus tamarii]|uniref:Uncharacterized protein n=1 Tax=Aspergillus tamarii TaxID=41984 RepID=A0A5N6UMZ2_ASPTM|nr:hypothetical protein BDV40DRAFT_271806 [Aspergillus tamarii]
MAAMVLRIGSVRNDQLLSGGEPSRCPFMNKIIIVASKENKGENTIVINQGSCVGTYVGIMSIFLVNISTKQSLPTMVIGLELT